MRQSKVTTKRWKSAAIAAHQLSVIRYTLTLPPYRVPFLLSLNDKPYLSSFVDLFWITFFQVNDMKWYIYIYTHIHSLFVCFLHKHRARIHAWHNSCVNAPVNNFTQTFFLLISSLLNETNSYTWTKYSSYPIKY